MPVTIETTFWGGWPDCYRIANGEAELIITGNIGAPRATHCSAGRTCSRC